MTQVFISYSEEDSAVARGLAGELRKLGLTTWAYEENGLPGISYLEQVHAAIHDSHAFILLASVSSLKSRNVIREAETAYESQKLIIPVRLGITPGDLANRPIFRMVSGTAVSILTTLSTVGSVAASINATLQHVGDGGSNLLSGDVKTVQASSSSPKQDANTASGRATRKEPSAATPEQHLTTQTEAAPDLPDPLPSPPPVPTSILESLARLVRQDSLNSDEQIRLVVDLKASLLDPKLAPDARSLLEQVRSRPGPFERIAREVDQALPTDRLSIPPEASARTSSDDEAARGAAPTKRRSLELILQTVFGGGIVVTIVILVLYTMLFSPRIDVQATDVDWEPRNPQVGQRVTVTGKYAISYRIRKGLRWSRDEVLGQKLNDIFTATWSFDGRETNLEDPRTVTAGDVVEATFETTFERAGPHEIAFSVRSQKSDAEASKKKVVRMVYVQ